MREILFRGKRVDTGKWIEGVAFTHDKDECLILFQHPIDGSLTGYEVDPETVGQYTGLKDKNDKKIFTGDILTDAWGKKLTVYFDSCYLQIRAKEIGSSLTNSISYYANISKLKVIGNIHDNPELLEVKK